MACMMDHWKNVYAIAEIPPHTDNCGNGCRYVGQRLSMDTLYDAWWHDCCTLCNNLATAWRCLELDELPEDK